MITLITILIVVIVLTKFYEDENKSDRHRFN
jgi:hypothetical protein